MESRAFSDSAILRAAWQRTKDRLGFLIIVGIILAIFFGLSSVLIAYISTETAVGGIIAQVIYYILSAVVSIGITKIVLDIADGKEGALIDLITHWNVLLKYIGVTIVYAVVVYVGFFLLLFPGVIWMLKFFFAPWLVIDKGMGPIKAMKASSRMTMGMKWDLIGFIAVGYAVLLLGLLALGIGLIVAIPLFTIATAMVYRHMLKGIDMTDLMPGSTPAPVAVAPTA